jgi:predicted NACHT family NTPase
MLDTSVDIFLKLVRSAYQGMADYAREQDFFKTATRKYVAGLLERNSTIKVLTMPDPRPLESLYVRANILKDRITAEQGDSAEELEQFFDRDRRSFGQSRETVDGELMANKLQRFIVLGKPGAGKTTYLRYLTLKMLQPDSGVKKRKLPIFVTLREWADKKMPLMDFIVQQFHICGFEQAQDFVERMLAAGDCLVLFDGLDEVSQEADQRGIIRQIKDFCDKYNENQFIISCRVAAYNRQFERFSDVEMADFSPKQQESFIQNWFDGHPDLAKRCWDDLRESKQLSEMAAVPLLLTLLCIAYNRRKSFPANRAELYEEAIDALLRDWDATRDIRRDAVYKQLSMKYKKSMFARIAWGTFKENMYFIPERILTKQIERYIQNLPGFKPEELEPDSHAVLRAIEAQHGIFVERAKKIHSFAHLTFQEFFTAKHLVDTTLNGSLEQLVETHFRDDKWLEVCVLTAEMLDDAGHFVLLMHVRNRKLLDEVPELNELLRVVQAAILPVESKYSRLEREWGGVYLALELVQVLTLAHVHAFTLANALDFNFDFAHTRKRDLALALTLDLDLEQLKASNLSPQIAEKIGDYLTGNLWLAKCLGSGAYISQEVRERVLGEMFKPKNLMMNDK